MPKEMAHSHLGMVTDGRYIYVVVGCHRGLNMDDMCCYSGFRRREESKGRNILVILWVLMCIVF